MTPVLRAVIVDEEGFALVVTWSEPELVEALVAVGPPRDELPACNLIGMSPEVDREIHESTATTPSGDQRGGDGGKTTP